ASPSARFPGLGPSPVSRTPGRPPRRSASTRPERPSGPPSQFLDEFHELPNHEIIELLTQGLRSLRRIPGDAGPVPPRVVDDRVRRDLVLPGRTLALHEIGAGGQDPRRLARARMAVALWQDALRRVDDVVVREDGRLKTGTLVNDFLRGRPQRHHVLSPGMAAQDHHATHAVPDDTADAL